MSDELVPDGLDTLAADADVYEVVAAFDRALEVGPDGHTLLKRWEARFPQHADDLATAGYARFAFGVSLADPVPDGWEGGPVPEKGPLVSLTDEAKALGLDPVPFARSLRLDTVLLARLSQRLLDAASLPRVLVGRLARTLDRPFDEVAAYLRQPPRLAAQGYYKSRRAPRLIAESRPPDTFAEVLQESRDLSDEDRAFWQTEIVDGGLLGREEDKGDE